jgi:glutamate carboxypeptidase
MTSRDPVYAEIDRSVAAGEAAALQRLMRWCAQNSGSTNPEGLGEMAGLLEADLADLGAHGERVALPAAEWIDPRGEPRTQPLGPALRLRRRPDAPIQFLLVGHMDTVFLAEDPFRDVILDAPSGQLRGPGVADAKGGLAVAALALKAFEQLDLAREVGWALWIAPDEELGSPGSAVPLRAAAAGFTAGLVFEPAQPGGALVGARKGSGNYTLVVHGRPAHAGRDPERGRNAVGQAARAVVELQRWNEGGKGVSVNVGTIHGGTARNVVPDRAVLTCNVRVATASDQKRVERRLRQLVARLDGDEGFRVELHGGFGRPPRPLDASVTALLEQLTALGAGMGLEIGWRDSGGVSDANVLGAAGLPAVDGLGPVGGGLHTPAEYIQVGSLGERARLCARFLAAAARGEIRWPPRGRGGEGDVAAAR